MTSWDIFGRDAELRTIGGLLDAAAHSPAALVLAGPVGAGKTTLLRAGTALAADRGYVVLQTMPAASDMRLAFAGLADLVEPRLGEILAELPAPQLRALRMALLLQDEPERPTEPRTIATALRSAIVILARSAPVLVVIDDAQWLDAPSAEAVGFTVRRLQHERVGLLCAQRTSRPGDSLPLQLEHSLLPVDVLPVGSLSLGALHRLLRIRLGSSFSHQTMRRIEIDSGGNPFIALEIGRALARRHIISVGANVLPLPDTLNGLVAERLGDLPGEVAETLRLVAVMPDAPLDQYLAAGASGADLDAAVLAGVLEADGGRLRFSHPLLATAVSGSIPPARLRDLHAAAARTVRLPEQRARHRALSSAESSSPVAQELDAAARSTAGQGAPASAAELYELAASLTPDDQPADAMRRHVAAAHQLAVAGETRAAIAALEELISAAPPGPARARAMTQLALLSEDDLEAEGDLLRQALGEAGADRVLTAEIHLGASALWLSHDSAQQRGHSEALLGLADAELTGDSALIASALVQVSFCDLVCGAELDEENLTRALRLEQAASTASLNTSPGAVAGMWHFYYGRLDAADAALQTVLSQAEAHGSEYARADILTRLSMVAGRRADARQAAAFAAAGLEIAELLDLPRLMRSLLLAAGRAALQLGDIDQVRDLARRGGAAAERTGERPYVALHQALLASLDLALGDSEAAAMRFGPMIDLLLGWGCRPTTQGVLPEAVEAMIGAGQLAAAAKLLAEVELRLPDPVTAALTARCHGALSAACGDLDQAAAYLAEAGRLHGLMSPQPMELGRTLLVLGGVQRRMKQRGAARRTLSDAGEIFESIGARLWAARARAELDRVSGRAPGPVALSVTEQRVTELVARGMSNREVAAALFVTVRAVESTLTKAYAKLGIRSRTELAARARPGS